MMPASQVLAAPKAAPEAIALDAQSFEMDLRNNNIVYHKVRIAQGATVVSADVGSATKQASGPNFDNSLWIFRGNVKITMDDGELTGVTYTSTDGKSEELLK